MRGLIVLSLLAVALAAPQYNYQAPISLGGSTGLGSLGLSSGSSNLGLLSGGGSLGGSSGGSLSSGGGYGNAYQAPQAPIISKHFHSFAAPEEQEDEGVQKTVNLGPSRKHYRVVFIKAPAQSSRAAAVSIAQAQNEEKTVIYVLSKKADAADIQTHIQEAHSVPSKPEVHFIKYKTQEEAAHAQRQIQAQYDSLGGTSQITDEGIAPISSVIGSLGGAGPGAAGSISQGSISQGSISPGAAYLPPN